jgi:hypothetical protein
MSAKRNGEAIVVLERAGVVGMKPFPLQLELPSVEQLRSEQTIN